MRLIFTLFFLALFISAQAQLSRGSITGKTIDKNGLPLPYATVYLEGTEFGTATNEQGFFLFKAPVGTYIIKCKSVGYLEQQSNVTVPGSGEVKVDFELTADITQLSEMVVTGVKMKSATAMRTLTEIQDIPQSIVVLGQKTISQQAAFDLSTITRNMSGINFTGNYSGAGSYQFFNARGFDMVNSQNYRWNGMMIWNLGNNYADNIEQVEFLKGPSSILFGDVAPGGVLNFATKKPLPDFHLKAEIRTGQWNLFRPAIDISGPLAANKKIRYRLNTSYETTKSFRNYVQSKRLIVAPSLTWDITDKLSVNTELVFKKSEATDDAGLVSPDGTVAGLKALDPSLYLGEPSMKYQFRDNSYFINLTYQLSQNWRIRAVGFYGNTKNRPWGIWPDSPNENGDFVRRQYGYHQWLKNGSASADISGTFYTGKVKHNLLVGAEYQSTKYRYTNEGYLDSLDTQNIYNMTYSTTPLVAPSDDSYLPFVSKIRRIGFYFQDQLMMMNEKIHVMLGFRLGNTQQGNDYFENELAGTNYEGYTDDLVNNWVFTPRIGIVYKPVSSTSLYASYAQGYEVNPPDVFAQNYAEFSTPPPTISSQFEFGTKTNFLNDKLGLTFSVFQIDKMNPYGYVYLDPENPNYDEYNVYYDGHHRSRGIEMDVDGKIHPALSLTLGAAYTTTDVIQDPGYPAGNQLPNAPHVTGNFWLNYDPIKKLKGLTVGFGAFYKDKFYSGIDNNPNLQVPASYTLDAMVGYTYKSLGVQVNVSNLTNQINYSNPWIFNLFEVRPLRRTVMTITYKFMKK